LISDELYSLRQNFLNHPGVFLRDFSHAWTAAKNRGLPSGVGGEIAFVGCVPVIAGYEILSKPHRPLARPSPEIH